MRRTWLMVTVCVAGFGLAESAAAQTAVPGQIEEVVVTAQKRTQNINDVGMAITAATGAMLKADGITDVSDLTRIEPSLQASQSQNDTPVYTLRGVGYFEQSLAATPTVSVYQDEVPIPLSPMGRGVLLDPERVEILKGPQGTLFGQNATGGAINFVAAKPTSSFAAGIDASYERFNQTKLDGYVSGPLTSTLNARLSASIDEGGAWQESRTRDDTLGNKDTQIARLLLDWRPNDRLKVSFNLNGWRDHSDTQAGQLSGVWFNDPGVISPNNLTPVTANYHPNAAYFATYPASIQALVREPLSPTNDQQADWAPGTHPHNAEYFYQGDVRADYMLTRDINLTSITSYEYFRENNIVDQGGVGYAESTGTVQGEADSVYQELRLNGHFGEGHGSWIFGVNYQKDGNHEFDYFDPLGVSPVFLTGGSQFSELQIAPFKFGAKNNTSANTYSAFAHVEYPILENLTVNGGIRYTKSDQSFVSCSTGDAPIGAFTNGLAAALAAAFGGATPIPAAPGTCGTLGPAPNFQPGAVMTTLNQSNVPWRAGLDWRPARNQLLYFSVSRGFKAGTAPALVGTIYTQYQPVKQESLISYELGGKFGLLDNHLQLDGALFHYDYKDKQELGRENDPLGIFGAEETLLNIPKSTEDGAELSAVWRPLGGVTLNASVTYLDSKVTSNFINYSPYVLSAADTVNFKGEAFPNTPKWSAHYGGRYDWALSDKLLAFVTADASYQSSTVGAFGASHADAIGAPSLAIKSYGLLNLSAGLQSLDKHWLVEVFGRNVTNTYYWNTVYWVGDSTLRYPGLPTTYGVRLSYKY